VLDGGAPTPESPRYVAPITVTRSAVLKVLAVDGTGLPGVRVEAPFFIEPGTTGGAGGEAE
jgi:hypothetical protein